MIRNRNRTKEKTSLVTKDENNRSVIERNQTTEKTSSVTKDENNRSAMKRNQNTENTSSVTKDENNAIIINLKNSPEICRRPLPPIGYEKALKNILAIKNIESHYEG